MPTELHPSHPQPPQQEINNPDESGRIRTVGGVSLSLLAELLALLLLSLALAALLHLAGPTTSLTDDALSQFRSGQIPLWRNTQPLLATGQTAIFHPATLLYLVVPIRWAWPAVRAVIFLLAATGGWLLCYRQNLSRPSRLIAAAAFSIACLPLPISPAETLASAPWVILATELVIQTPTPLRLAFAALAFASQFLAGDIPLLAILLPLQILLAFIAARRYPWGILPLAAAAILGFLLAGVQSIPTLQYLQLTNWHTILTPPALTAAATIVACLWIASFTLRSPYPIGYVLLVVGALESVIFFTSPKPPQPIPNSHPAIWEMPSVTLGQGGDPHKQLLVDPHPYNPYDEPIARLDLRPSNPFTPPQPGEDTEDPQWWTSTGPARDRLSIQYPDEQSITINTSGLGGWLVIDQPYYPGWQANVISNFRGRDSAGGRPIHVPIVRADDNIQTIFLPRLIRQVNLRYDPLNWRYALFTTIAGGLIVAMLFGLSLIYPHREVRP